MGKSDDSAIEREFYAETGKNLELRRKQCKIRQCALAKEVGVHRNSLMRWESGEAAIPLWMLVRIASALGCSYVSLMPSRSFTWGIYSEVWYEGLLAKKAVQSERDPQLSEKEKRRLRQL